MSQIITSFSLIGKSKIYDPEEGILLYNHNLYNDIIFIDPKYFLFMKEKKNLFSIQTSFSLIEKFQINPLQRKLSFFNGGANNYTLFIDWRLLSKTRHRKGGFPVGCVVANTLDWDEVSAFKFHLP